MGKASRLKKERKLEHTPCNPAPRAASGSRSDNLIVIDCNGTVHGEEASRQMYWQDVREALLQRGALCLPEMANLGAFMHISIFDVKLPVLEYATGREKYEDIFSATFLMEMVDCFDWLLSNALSRGCSHELLGKVFRNIVQTLPRIEVGSSRFGMATRMGKFMVEWFHREGVLIQAMADGNSVMGQSFARQIAEDYLAKLRADEEKAALDVELSESACRTENEGHAVEFESALTRTASGRKDSLRI